MKNEEGKNNHFHPLKVFLFRLYTFIIHYSKNSLKQKLIIILIQILQIISFSFEDKHLKYWKNEKASILIAKFLKSFRIYTFFIGGFKIYSFGFFLSIVTILIYTSLLISASLILSNLVSTREHIQLLTFILKTFEYFTYILFIPLMNQILSIFNCNEEGKNIYAGDFNCRGFIYIIYELIAIIFSILLFLLDYFNLMLGYNKIYHQGNISSKQTSYPEIYTLICQSLLIIMNETITNSKLLPIMYFIFTIGLLCQYMWLLHFYNSKLQKLKLFGALILICNSTSLFLSILFYKWNFDGGLILFFAGSSLSIILIYIYLESNYHQFDNTHHDPMSGYLIIGKLFDVVKEADSNKRKFQVFFKSYVFTHTQSCRIRDCALIQYNKALNEGKKNLYPYLIQHIDYKYNELIKQFPNNNFIQLMYAHFLYTKMDKAPLAKGILAEIGHKNLSFSDEFIYYRLDSFINHADENLFSQNNNLSYLILFNQFKKNIIKITNLYTNLWNSLLISRQTTHGTITELDNCGVAIRILKDQIEHIYNDIIKIKSNDIQTMKYYYDFLNDILNDYSSATLIKMKIDEIINEEHIDYSRDIVDIDLKNIQSTDKIQYIITSSNVHDIGNIIEVSLSFCIDAGYTHGELLGKNIDILLPEIFRKQHIEILNSKLHEFKNIELGNSHQKKKQFKTFNTFYLAKSHYIKPVLLSPALITTEIGHCVFIVKIAEHDHSHSFNVDVLANSTCFILTNVNFIIQNYTINCNSIFPMENGNNTLRDMFIGNYIVDFKAKKFQSPVNEIIISWSSKKRKNSICNNEFKCSSTEVYINKIKLGYVFSFVSYIPKMQFSNKSISTSEKIIDDNYIPQHDKIFAFDMNNLTFSLNPLNESNTREKTVQHLKQKAMNFLAKATRKTTNSTSSNEESESEEIEERDKSENEEEKEKSKVMESDELTSPPTEEAYELNNAKVDNIDNREDEIDKLKQGIKNNEIREYYNVKMSKIKFFIYNYNLKSYDDYTKKFTFISKVQQVIKNFTEDTSINKRLGKREKKEDIKMNKISYEKEKIKQENKIIKQIQYSLDKYEAASSIITFKIIGFFTFLILFCEGVIIYIIFTDVDKKLDETSGLVQYSYRLLLNCVYALFFTREITLLANKDYSVTFQNMKDYQIENKEGLIKICNKIQELTTYILTTSVSLSKESEKILYGDTFEMYMITPDLQIKKFNLTLNAAIGQTTSSLYVLSTLEIDEVVPTLEIVYFSLLNSFNALLNGLLSQASVLADEYKSNNKRSINIFLYCLICFFCFGIFSFIILSKKHFQLVNKKEAYLAVFEEINITLIATLLEKCINFTQKISIKNAASSGLNNNGNMNSNYDDDNESEDGQFLSIETKKSTPKQKEKEHNKHKQLKDVGKETWEKRALLLFAVSLGPILALIIFFISKSTFNSLDSEMEFYRQNSRLNVKYLNLINLIREYIFDKDIDVNYMSLEEFLLKELENMFLYTLHSRSLYENATHFLPKEYIDFYKSIYYDDICPSTKSFFDMVIKDENRTCYSITFNAAHYGLSVLVPQFIDQIKTVKNKFDLNMALAEEKGYKYNLTLYGLDEYYKLNESFTREKQEEYFKMHPIQFLNSAEHDDLVIIYRHIFQPTFLEMINILEEVMKKQQNQLKIIIDVIVIGYCCIILLFYLIVWKTIEKNVGETINKAKNMLMILPKEILVGLESVYMLFKISALKEQKGEEENEEENNNNNNSGNSK